MSQKTISPSLKKWFCLGTLLLLSACQSSGHLSKSRTIQGHFDKNAFSNVAEVRAKNLKSGTVYRAALNQTSSSPEISFRFEGLPQGETYVFGVVYADQKIDAIDLNPKDDDYQSALKLTSGPKNEDSPIDFGKIEAVEIPYGDPILQVSQNPLDAVDQDQDGMPDSQDKDSDNDGISNALDSRADEDGFDQTVGTIDLDEDGTPDVFEDNPPEEFEEKLKNRTRGDSGTESDGGEASTDSSASDASDPGPRTVRSKFDVKKDGYSFMNFRAPEHLAPPVAGNKESAFLDANDMVELFGTEAVCKNKDANNCDLTEKATQFMDKNFGPSSKGGMCFGMAKTAQLIYNNKLPHIGTEAHTLWANKVIDRKIVYNQDVRHTIAKYQILTSNVPIQNPSKFFLKKTTAEIIQILEAEIAKDKGTIPLIDLKYKSWGHALVPIAVEQQENSKSPLFHIIVYDPNHPDEEMFIEVNTKNDQWSYKGLREVWSQENGGKISLISSDFDLTAPKKLP